MRTLGRCFLATLLAALLAVPPALGSPAKPVGIVLQTERAMLRSAQVTPGTTVFAGDTVTTDRTGTLIVRMASGQVSVLGDSIVIFEDSETGADATLLRGGLAFTTAEAGSLTVRAAGVTIRPQSKLPSQAQIALLGPIELLVTTYRGPLELRLEDETLTLPEGTTYKLFVQGDSRGPGPVGAGAEDARRAKLRAFFIAFAVVALPLVGTITYHLLASPSSIF